MCILQLKLCNLCCCMNIYTYVFYLKCGLNLRYFSKIICRFIKAFTVMWYTYTYTHWRASKIKFSTTYRRECCTVGLKDRRKIERAQMRFYTQTERSNLKRHIRNLRLIKWYTIWRHNRRSGVIGCHITKNNIQILRKAKCRSATNEILWIICVTSVGAWRLQTRYTRI
jgi:hypothetical protein